MSDETEAPKRVTGEHPATNLEVHREGNAITVKTIVTAVVGIFTAGWFTYAAVVHASETILDAGVAPVTRRVGDLEERFDRHVREESIERDAQAKKVDEIQTDIRALYRAVMTKQPQPRLEHDAGLIPE